MKLLFYYKSFIKFDQWSLAGKFLFLLNQDKIKKIKKKERVHPVTFEVKQEILAIIFSKVKTKFISQDLAWKEFSLSSGKSLRSGRLYNFHVPSRPRRLRVYATLLEDSRTHDTLYHRRVCSGESYVHWQRSIRRQSVAIIKSEINRSSIVHGSSKWYRSSWFLNRIRLHLWEISIVLFFLMEIISGRIRPAAFSIKSGALPIIFYWKITRSLPIRSLCHGKDFSWNLLIVLL